MSIRAEHQLEESFLKNVSYEAVASRGVSYKKKYVPSTGKGGDCVAHSFNCTSIPPAHGGVLPTHLFFVCIFLGFYEFDRQ